MAGKIKLIIEYDGTDFSGFQVQGDRRTVQGVLEEAVADLCGRKIRIEGAGRTDAGVHARGQVVSFENTGRLAPEKFTGALNARLPRDLKVLKSQAVDSGFHARFSARAKTYSYRIMVRDVEPVLERDRVFWRREALDPERLNQTASRFLGTHDFAAFQSAEGEVKDTVRTLTESRVESRDSGIVVFWFTADGFLNKMVRNLVGVALWVHDGTLAQADADRMIETAARPGPIFCAPPQGLALERVYYDPIADSGSKG